MKASKGIFLAVSVALLSLLLVAGLFGQSMQKDSVYRYLSIFTEVFSLVRSNYVDPVEANGLVDGAFTGITDAIDEFSYYVPPADMPTYRNHLSDETRSVGIVLTKRFGYAYVISVLPGSAAEKGDIEAGDLIESINGVRTEKEPIWKIRDALQAREGKPVSLTVIRGGMTDRRELTLQAQSLDLLKTDVRYYDDVAYVKAPYFVEGSHSAFRRALEEVRKKGRNRIIIDVRGNAGPAVEEAIAAADDFLGRGVITSVHGRRADKQTWNADEEKQFEGEVTVLIDRSTAGAGEVFASAISGNKRGRTVGVGTFGRSIVQKLVLLPSGGGLHMTIAHYTTPDLKPIEQQGVRPDVLVDLSSVALREAAGEEVTEDVILEKALALLAAEKQLDEAA